MHDGVFVALDDFDVLNSEAEASNPAVWSPAFLPSVKSIVDMAVTEKERKWS